MAQEISSRTRLTFNSGVACCPANSQTKYEKQWQHSGPFSFARKCLKAPLGESRSGGQSGWLSSVDSRLDADSGVQDVTWIIRDCSALLLGTKLCTTSAKNVSLWNDGLSTIPTPTVSTEGAWSAAAATAFTRSVFLQERVLVTSSCSRPEQERIFEI